MTEIDLGASGVPAGRARVRAVPASLIGVAPAPYRTGGRANRLMRLGVAAAIWLGLAVALAPVGPSANEDLAAAARARATYRYDRALAWYASAGVAAPNDPRPICATGDVRSLQHEWSLAEVAYERCLALQPADVAATWLALGDARAAAGDEAGALTAWQRSADAGGSAAIRRLGDAYETAGDVDAAVAVWKRLPSNDAEARAHLGMLALWRGDAATARADFVVVQNQLDAASQSLLSDGFASLATGGSLDAEAWGKLGYAFLVANRPALALVPLRTATHLDQDGESAHAYLGWTLWLLAQQGVTPSGTPTSFIAEAMSELQRTLKLSSSNSFAWFAAGTVSAASGDLRVAYADLAKAVALDGRNPAIWSAAGNLALAQADYVAAELDFGSAARFSTRPDETVTLLHFYAERGYGLGDGRAMTAAAAAARRWPQSEPIRFLQAEIADETGAQDTATYAARAAVLLDPTDPGPYTLLGRYAFQAGAYMAAAGYLRVAIALQPDGPWAAQATALAAPLHSLDV